MIEHLIDALLAREQVTLLLGGIGMVLLGGVFMADHFYWRMRAARYTGILIGVREKTKQDRQGNAVYFPVVQYTDEAGNTITAETDTGTSSLKDKIPGNRVTLLVRPGKPHEARILGLTGLIIGLIFTAIGTLLGAIALTQYAINAWTFIIGVLLITILSVLGLWKLAKSERLETSRGFSARKYEERLKRKQGMPLLGMEEIGPRVRQMDARARKIAPVMGLLGLAMLGTGHWLAQDLYHLLAFGKTADGRIIGYERVFRSTDQTHVYYPKVVFITARGENIGFRDKIGSGSATTGRRSGAEVTVIYNPNNPEQARIDRGWWNWAIPCGLLFFGALIIFLTLCSYNNRKHRRNRI